MEIPIEIINHEEQLLVVGVGLFGDLGLLQYLDVFSTIGYVLLIIAAIIFLLNKPIKKLMHGVE